MTSTRPRGTATRGRLLLTALTALALAGTPVLAPALGAPAPAAPGSAAPAVAALAGATPGRPAAAPGARARRPNVVMVMADDMRADDLRFAPNVRRLIGGHGLTFANSFSPYPLCCPARASFLTGQYTHNHGVFSHRRPYGYRAFDDSRTLATSLHRVGYRTALVGKYLNGYGTMRSRVSGRRSYRYVPRGWTDWRASVENPGRDLDPGDTPFVGGTYAYFDTAYNHDGRIDASHRGEYQTSTIGSFGASLVRRYHRGRAPFFLYLSYVAPHHGSPTEPDDPSRSRPGDSLDEGFRTPARPRWVRGRFDRAVRQGAGMPPGGGPAERDVRDKPVFFRLLPELTRAEKRALREVTRQRAEAVYVMDRQVGKLVAQLKRTGEWRSTVLMFTSDNGYFLGEHRQRTGKIRAHEPSLRVPFLLTGPGVRSGETRYDPITTVDVTATVLDLAGARPPRRPDGTSRWAQMRAADRGWQAPVVTEASHSLRPALAALPTNPDGDPATPPVRTRRDPSTLPLLSRSAYPGAAEQRDAEALFGPGEERTSIGLRTPRWSFSLYRNGEGELYDMATDPTQEVNRYSDPDYADVVSELRGVWSAYRDCSGAACREPMAADLRAEPVELARLARVYRRGLQARYGHH